MLQYQSLEYQSFTCNLTCVKDDIQVLILYVYRKLKLELPYNSVIPLMGICSREIHGLKGYIYLSVHCSTIYNSYDMEKPKCPLTDE